MTATSPTASTAERAHGPLASLVIAVVLGTLLSGSVSMGTIYYLVRSGHMHLIVSPSAASLPDVQQSTRTLALDPLLVNLADAGGNAYLRVGLTLRVLDAADKGSAKQGNATEKAEGDKSAAAGLRDTALAVLGHQESKDLLVPDGKEHLKDELKRAFEEHNAEAKVKDVYFTEFLVQR